MVCKIVNWSGRFGNSIIQLVNCIYYALKYNHNIVIYPKLELIEETSINNNNNNNIIIEGNFFI
jgi:hypothetical protein